MTAAEPIETVAVAFIKMKEDKTDPVPGHFIHKDEKDNPEMTGEVLIPINRTPIKTVAEDLVKKSWDSIGERQYTKAMEGTLNVQECPNLDKARETLEKVLGMAKAPYPYDRCVSHPGNLNPSNYVTIGGHDFYKNKQFRSCVKPDGWDEMPVAPGSPLDK